MRRTPPNLVLVPGTPAPPPRRTTEDDRATIVHVAGARRSLVKLAPVVAALEQRQIFCQLVVFTGQHSDMPGVDRWHGVGLGTPGLRFARVLAALEPVLAEAEPEAVVVAGDPSAALASALAASKLGIAVAHLDAGLRASDREELGRVLTDRLADTLFAPDKHAAANLEAEGVAAERIHVVGDAVPAAGAIPLRSGHAAERIADVLVANYALTAGARDGGAAPAL